MNTVTIPVLEYKMDKVKAILVSAIIVIVIIALVNPNFISNLIQSIAKAVGNIGGQVVDGVGKTVENALGDTPTTDDATILSATSTIDSMYVQWTNTSSDPRTTVSGPFCPCSYVNPQASNLDYNTLKSVIQNIWDALPSSFLGIYSSHGDGQALFNAFSPCQSQNDIGNVVVEFNNEKGMDLFQTMTYGSYSMIGRNPAGDKQANVVWLLKLINWANSLPKQ